MEENRVLLQGCHSITAIATHAMFLLPHTTRQVTAIRAIIGSILDIFISITTMEWFRRLDGVLNTRQDILSGSTTYRTVQY